MGSAYGAYYAHVTSPLLAWRVVRGIDVETWQLWILQTHSASTQNNYRANAKTLQNDRPLPKITTSTQNSKTFLLNVKIRYVVEQSVLQKAPKGAIEVLDEVSTAWLEPLSP